MRYYMITLDRCKTDVIPNKENYFKIIRLMKVQQYFEETGIFCFEYKQKSDELKKWIHFHCIVKSTGFLYYTKFIQFGYSIKCMYLKTTEDIVRAAVYINKNKTDEVCII